MKYIDSIKDSIPELLDLADLLKEQRPILTEYEALRIAVEIWKADAMETLDATLMCLKD